MLDVGTGSGAIALAIADEHPGARVTGDRRRLAEALSLAAENAARTGLADRVTLLEQDLTTGLPGGPYDLVVSNPPYVLPEEIDSLEAEVREWEPRQALVGRGATEAVARAAPGPSCGRAGGSCSRSATGRRTGCRSLLTSMGFAQVAHTPDLAGRQRVVEGTWES